MGSKVHEQQLLLAKELKAHLENEHPYRSMQSVDRAFVNWYLAARFGDLPGVTKEVTDKEGDGGIDAVAEKGDEVFIFQMKYEKVPRLSTISRDEIAGFEKVANLFKNSKQNEFEEWLKTVNPGLVKTYNHLRGTILSGSKSARFIFVTTKRISRDLSSNSPIEVTDAHGVLALWELYQEGFTPPVEQLTFRMESSWDSSASDERYTTYVGLADLREFRKAMEKDRNDRLFAQNVRTFLPTKVNEAIKGTYENEPENFWLGNNGIYIVCKDVVASGKEYKLTYPSIINGSQTLHSIKESKHNNECRILVRILKMDIDSDHQLLSEIIRRTNSQNTMNPINLFAHDPFQLHLARYLHNFKVFYERREKEWKNEKRNLLDGYSVVTIREMAQWLSVSHRDIGLGPARSNLASLFEEGTYKKLFCEFDAKLKNAAYKNVHLLIWSGFLQKNVAWYLSDKSYSRAKIAHLLLTKAIYSSIKDKPSLHEKIGFKLEHGEFGKKNVPTKLIAFFSQQISKVAAIQKRMQQKDEQLDFSNFFKRKHFPEEAFAKVFTPRVLKTLGDLIVNQEEKIY